ncbi:Hypothetical protein NTJ_01291 [Nesidiocoris tenuis]|uniref:Transcription termination factor, mitochondrial n=1 Tax=Nesidiocoris tenuis TaxID=355587 RepID=A0ABN7ACD0_9HEMI|nr:Hypothetical protein NTJ_01291 [Nesidiocoris tenuis]
MFRKRLWLSLTKVSEFPHIPHPLQARSLKTTQWKKYDESDVKNHVANIFLCSQKEANDLVDFARSEFENDRCGRIEILRSLRKKGLNIKHVWTCKSVLKLPNDTVQQRLAFCSEATLNNTSPPMVISVLRLKDEDFNVVRRLVYTNSAKVRDFSELFECSKVETCQYFIKHPFLLRSRITTLKAKCDLLVENGIPKEEILKDLWVLTYTKKRLEERLDDINQMNFDPKKPWMLRCLPEVLLRAFQNKQENEAALDPYPNRVTYLTNRLGISEDKVKTFAQKHPPVMRVQVSKMNEIIDYLMSEGYPAEKIVQTPRILCHSLVTIQVRMEKLKQRNYVPQTLSTLCKSKRSFEEFIRKVELYNETVDD